jgi:hypothetical protein
LAATALDAAPNGATALDAAPNGGKLMGYRQPSGARWPRKAEARRGAGLATGLIKPGNLKMWQSRGFPKFRPAVKRRIFR